MRNKIITKKLCLHAYKILEYRHELVIFWISVLQLKSLVLLIKPMSGSFSLMSSQKRFIFSGLTPKSLTILSQFLYTVQMGVQFHYSTCGCCFPAPIFEKTTLQPMCILNPCQSRLTAYMWIYFQVLFSVPFVYMSLFISITSCFNYYSFAMYFEITLKIFFKFVSVILYFLLFHMNFGFFNYISVKCH